ncbi:MAG: hypothetical protein WA633_02465, partial [Stellaceae bacterium]
MCEKFSMPNDAVEEIHQILINDTYCLPSELPATIEANAASLRSTYPNAKYRLWSGNDLRKMIAENFEPAALNAFDVLRPFSYKSDIARFCLLYVY